MVLQTSRFGPLRSQSPLILLNASHTVMGGGLTYLQGVIRQLGGCSEFRWLLLAPERTLSILEIPPDWATRAAPSAGFFALHFWEQCVLPLWARRHGVSVVLCNANYVPLAAPRPIPILHSPSSPGRAQAKTLRHRVYWRTLDVMTELSLWRSSHAIAIADIAIHPYRAARALDKKRKLFHAPPGKPAMPGPSGKDPDLVVAAGNILSYKRYDLLVRAMEIIVAQRPSARLEIIGHAFDQALAADLHRLVGDLGLTGRVTLAGFIPHDRLMRRMREASILVSASVAEVANLVVLEAMTIGTPVVLADTDAQREMAGPAGLLVSDNDDPARSYANALLALLEDSARQRAMAEAGRRRAERFNWANTASAIVDALRAVVAREPDETDDTRRDAGNGACLKHPERGPGS
jgi:glycosyltransferase involved in cell wall biosynthesis